jgi:branched-subunit amino acid aminotransferase/4-amino-4-deoxychorismate lyase
MAELNGIPVNVDQLQALALTNYGHFTSMRVEDGAVRGLGLHLQRLQRDCQVLFGVSLDLDQVRQLVRHAVAGGPDPAVVRVTVFDPYLELGHPSGSSDPQVLVTTRPAVSQPQPPLRVRSASFTRDLPAVKHVGLFGLLRERRTAQLAGFDDVLFTDRDGRLSEGGTWNVGFVKGDDLIWPDADCLPGVTLAVLNQVHRGTIEQRSVRLADLPQMDAAFATNAAVGVRTIRAIDDVEWADEHPLLGVLRREYNETPNEPV